MLWADLRDLLTVRMARPRERVRRAWDSPLPAQWS